MKQEKETKELTKLKEERQYRQNIQMERATLKIFVGLLCVCLVILRHQEVLEVQSISFQAKRMLK